VSSPVWLSFCFRAHARVFVFDPTPPTSIRISTHTHTLECNASRSANSPSHRLEPPWHPPHRPVRWVIIASYRGLQMVRYRVSYLVHSILARPSSYRDDPRFLVTGLYHILFRFPSWVPLSLSLPLCFSVVSSCMYFYNPYLLLPPFYSLFFLFSFRVQTRFSFFLVSHHLNEPLISDTRFPLIQTHSHTTTIRIATTNRICMYLIHPPHTSHFTHSSIK